MSGEILKKIKANLIPTIAFLMVLPILVSLGFWQLDRARQKSELQAMYDARMSDTPFSVGEQIANPTDLQFYRVEVQGYGGGGARIARFRAPAGGGIGEEPGAQPNDGAWDAEVRTHLSGLIRLMDSGGRLDLEPAYGIADRMNSRRSSFSCINEASWMYIMCPAS